MNMYIPQNFIRTSCQLGFALLLVGLLAACNQEATPPPPVKQEVENPATVAIEVTSVQPAGQVESDLKKQLQLLTNPLEHAGNRATNWDLATVYSAMPRGDEITAKGSVTFWMNLEGPADGVTVKASVLAADKTYQGIITLSGQGWRRIVLPVAALNLSTDKIPEKQGHRLQLVGSAPSGLRVTIADECRSEKVMPAASGEVDLLAQIDWSVPGLEGARDRLAVGDRAGALHGLATYVRKRPLHWKFPPLENSSTLRSSADRILSGEVQSIGLTHKFSNGKIDWLFNPTLGTKEASSEWVWSLNRHKAWTNLAMAYRSTRDSKYAQGWTRNMRAWVEQAPAPAVSYENSGSAWRSIEAGLRMTNAWFTGFYAVVDCPSVSDRDILLYLQSLWDHAQNLSVTEFDPDNHFVFAMTGLYTVGSEFPEFIDAKRWRTTATRQLERSLTVSTLNEGGWYELAPGYGNWVCSNLIEMWNNAERSGQDADLSPGLRAKLQKMAEWSVHLMAPNREAPMLNDGGALKFNSKSTGELAARFPESTLLNTATRLLEGEKVAPAWTSEALSDSGYTVMRTGWGTKDSYLLFDVGPLGGWHGHQDALNLVAYFHGRYFLFDNGGYKYDSSDWRKYGPSTASHNTVLVDGMGQVRTWNGDVDAIGANPKDMPAPQFITNKEFDYASGWYVSGYGKTVANRGKSSNKNMPSPASHRREVFFLKSALVEGQVRGPLAFVLDKMTPNDSAAHTYEARWHIKTTRWKTDKSKHITWTNDPGLPNLAIVSLTGADTFSADSGVLNPELLGWWYQDQNSDPVPALTLRHARNANGEVRFLTALIPFTDNPDNNPFESIRTIGVNAWTIRLRGQLPITVRLQTTPGAPSILVDGVSASAFAR